MAEEQINLNIDTVSIVKAIDNQAQQTTRQVVLQNDRIFIDSGKTEWIGFGIAILIPVLVAWWGVSRERKARERDFLFQERLKFYTEFMGYVKDIANALYNFGAVYELDPMEFNGDQFEKCCIYFKRNAIYKAKILFKDEILDSYINKIIAGLDKIFDKVLEVQNILCKKSILTKKQIDKYIDEFGIINDEMFAIIEDEKMPKLLEKLLRKK